MDDFVFPLRKRPEHDYRTGGRRFGASRSSGSRLHAGCDLIAPQGTEILAMADGVVVRGPYDFYGGTSALEVRHGDGKIARYGEISKIVPAGIGPAAAVTQGQVLAKVGLLDSGSSMLHLELYGGTATGRLTQPGTRYMRRSDLIDPTPYLDAARLAGQAPVAPASVAAAATLAPHHGFPEGRVSSLVTSSLRVHSAASTTSPTLFALAAGERVAVLSENVGEVYEWDRRDWLEIEHGGLTGFAAGYYIEVGTAAPDGGVEDRWVTAMRRATTSGASATTAAQDGLVAGVAASHAMAETDAGRVEAIAQRFASVAGKFGIPAAILAAIASRESRCGAVLTSGWGDRGNAFGILQVDKRHHSIRGLTDPASVEHIEQAADIFCAGLESVAARHPDWKEEHLLQGAAVAYNSGVVNVQSIAGMDNGTTGDDYGSDVLARAQYYSAHPRLALFRA